MSAQVKTALDKALDYAKQAEDTAFQRAKGTAESNAEALAKQLYTQKMVQQKTLGNVMQNAGLSTQGYSETTANAIGSNYQNNWNQAMMQKNDQIAGAQSQKDIATANLQSKYQTDLANYYASLEQAKAKTTSSNNGSTPKKESLDIVTKQAGLYLKDGKIDETGLTAYLKSMVANKSITEAQADAIWDQIKKNQQGSPNPNAPGAKVDTTRNLTSDYTNGGKSWTAKPGENVGATSITGGGKSTSKERNQQAIW